MCQYSAFGVSGCSLAHVSSVHPYLEGYGQRKSLFNLCCVAVNDSCMGAVRLHKCNVDHFSFLAGI